MKTEANDKRGAAAKPPLAKKPSARLDADDWIEASLDLMASSSVDAVRVEPLAKKLGVTKGSFYWHFKDRDGLLIAILDKWRRRATLDVVEKLESSDLTPGERIQRLLALPLGGATARKAALVDVALRGWARRDRMAYNALAEVDEYRLRYLIDLMRQENFPEREASVRAFLIYAYQLAETLIPEDGRVGFDGENYRTLCLEILLGRSGSATHSD